MLAHHISHDLYMEMPMDGIIISQWSTPHAHTNMRGRRWTDIACHGKRLWLFFSLLLRQVYNGTCLGRPNNVTMYNITKRNPSYSCHAHVISLPFSPWVWESMKDTLSKSNKRMETHIHGPLMSTLLSPAHWVWRFEAQYSVAHSKHVFAVS